MLKKKFLKIAFVMVCIITLIMPYTTTVLAAALTSNDVKYSLERMVKKLKMASLLEKVEGYQDLFDGKADELSGIVVIDDTHFEIHMAEAYTPLLSALSTPYCAIYPAEACEAGGTITGIGEVLKALNPDMEIWAVEPENAAILAGGTVGTHLQMGIGDGVIPPILNKDIYDEIYVVTDEEAIQTAKDLARLEGLMCGISSGTNVAAALKLAKKLGKGKTVVTVLPDTAERYFSTPLFDE